MKRENDIMKFAERLRGLTEEEVYFISSFGNRTHDKELIDKLFEELKEEGHDFDQIKGKYSAIAGIVPAWVAQAGNLLTSLEMYRREEEKVINKLSKILEANGIDMSEEELRVADTDAVKARVSETQKEEDDRESSESEEDSIYKQPLLWEVENMEVTDIRLNMINKEGGCKAIGSFSLDSEFAIRGVRVMEDKNGKNFVAFPSRAKANGEYEDIAFPLNKDFYHKITEAICEEYHHMKEEQQSKNQSEQQTENQAESQTQAAPKKGKSR